MSRWETESNPPIEWLEPIAKALNVSVSELIGITPLGVNLSGVWYAVWDTTRDGIRTLNRHTLNAKHSGEFIYFDAEGDYTWRADLRLRGLTITGTYQAVDGSRDELGSMCLTMDLRAPTAAIGHWNGAADNCMNNAGFGVLARDYARADRLMKILLDSGDPTIREWPREDTI